MLISRFRQYSSKETLKWDLDGILEMIEPHLDAIALKIDAIDIGILKFKKFGKGLIKKWRLSPDAIVQAYFIPHACQIKCPTD